MSIWQLHEAKNKFSKLVEEAISAVEWAKLCAAAEKLPVEITLH